MGNESSAYGDCEFQEEINTSSNKHIVIQQAVTKDGTPISVLVYDCKELKSHVRYVDSGAKLLKTLKHPGILKFLTLIDHSDEKWLITERITPLEVVLSDMSPTEICAGLYNIIETTSFLHDRGGICHNNISLSSIYVSSDGTWKLGNFEYACKFTEADSLYLGACNVFRNEKSIPPEEKAGKVTASEASGRSRDSYAFGVLSENILEHISSLGTRTVSFEKRIHDELLNPDPKCRPKLTGLLQDQLFQDDFIEMLNFLKNVTLKSEDQKRQFFSTLTGRLFGLPPVTVATRLLKHLLSRFVLLDKTACEDVMPHLLTPAVKRSSVFTPDEINPVLPEPLFRKYMLPEIFKIFHVRDAHIRMVLLRNFSDYCHLFPKSTLTALFPQILLGLRDQDDDLVAMTLHCVADLVPLLGGDVVIGAHRSKIFSQGIPKFDCMVNGTVAENSKPPLRIVPPKAMPERDAEKERRREEARRRSEERKKKREEQKLARKTVTDEHIDTRSEATQAKAEDGYPADTHSQGGSNDIHMPESTTDSYTLGGTTDAQNDNTKRRNSNNSETSSIEEDDYHDDDDMINTLSPLDSHKFAASRLEIEADPVTVDWSDVQQTSVKASSNFTKSGKGALKLSKTRKTEPKPERVSVSSDDRVLNDADEWGDDNWGETALKSPKKTPPKSPPKSPKVRAVIEEDSWGGNNEWDEIPAVDAATDSIKSSNHSKAPVQKTPPVKNSHLLGAEFDIMALDIKTKQSESNDFDFFADMQPDLKPQGNSLMSILNTEVSSASNAKKSSKSPEKTSVSFAVADITDDTSGWGAEDDWNDLDNDLDS